MPVHGGSKMKVVGIISSPHGEGNTATLVREALAAAAAAGAEVTEVFLPQYRIEHCRACDFCLAAGRCLLADDFEAVKAILADADGIILSSPTYGAAPCGRIRILFDRLGQLAFLSSFVGGKYVAAIATAGSFGAGKTAKELAGIAQSSVLQRAHVSGTLSVALRGRHARQIPRGLEQARRLGDRMVRDIGSRRRYLLQGFASRLLYALVLGPAIRRHVVANSTGTMKGVYEALVRKGILERAA